jgi:predicted nucleic acid-binding protein
MARISYILDTNVISDYIKQFHPTTQAVKQAIRDKHTLYLSSPVRYEVVRGLQFVNATRQQNVFTNEFAPLLDFVPLLEADWMQAAQFWVLARQQGKQLADTDLLIAALAKRLDGIIVSADNDFDVLPIQRVNWRKSTN